MEITYFVHGATEDNEINIASGWGQVSLSPKGIEQTRLAAQIIDSMIYEKIFVSDLLRAIESAQILFPNRKESIIVESRLRECNYGSLTSKPNSMLVYSDHINSPFPNGESLFEVEERVRRFLEETKELQYHRIAIVGHRAPQLALDVITKDITWESAINEDWRASGKWQPGWLYTFS